MARARLTLRASFCARGAKTTPLSFPDIIMANAGDLRARFRELTKQKEALEARIQAAVARLNAPGGAGTDKPLVDREGFPRADVADLAAAARDRRDLLCWTNDHKALMVEVERVMHALMAAGGGGGGAVEEDKMEEDGEAARPTATTVSPPPRPAAAAEAPLPPFASVGDVAPCSPAAAAGMQVGDLVVRLAGVDATAAASSSSTLLQQVSAALQASEGHACAAVVVRAGRRVALELTPRAWAGRGLLGCHLRPLALPGGEGGAAAGNGA